MVIYCPSVEPHPGRVWFVFGPYQGRIWQGPLAMTILYQNFIIRKGDETLIEPHAFTKEEFDDNVPIVRQIIKYGERIEI